ncbi:FxsC protein [Streptacidiphilus carbonis]|uniref:FxsC protein n=1 Tax=Streptacidiphilus carbonis TaxID=105422 RepID=UPI0005A80B35|nr:FxsC protein [Streptacidiphilus carbonis]
MSDAATRSPRTPAHPGGNAPWFYLSYAHAHGAPVVDSWATAFYADLTEALLRRVGGVDPEAHGFLDLPGGSETGRQERRAGALARCRSLVALCSPDYFTDLECHNEWVAFHRRGALRGSPGEALVPVLWERLWSDSPAGVGLDRRALAQRFGEDGLRASLAKTRMTEQYRYGVQWTAEAVRSSAERVVLSAGHLDALEPRPQPWPGHPLERTLRIQVLALASTDPLPPGCDPSRYGERPTDWRPYGADSALPAGEFAARLALSWNIHVTAVESFEEAAEDGAAGRRPEGPRLLLLDRWALLNPRLRELLLNPDRRQRHPVAVMVPWDRRLPGARDHGNGTALQQLTLETLDRAVGRPKPDYEPLRRGIPDSAAFAALLPQAVEQARKASFIRRR